MFVSVLYDNVKYASVAAFTMAYIRALLRISRPAYGTYVWERESIKRVKTHTHKHKKAG